MSNKLPKIIVLLGPTASGKSDLSVEIALEFNGEVVSADSRQVYRGLDIGTGKITPSEMHGVPHYLLDVANPQEQYSVAHYKRDAEQAIGDVLSRKKLPILCGGTGLYIQAITDNITSPETKPDASLRQKLASKTPEELFALLREIDPSRARNIDPKNPRRLIRAIEIAQSLGFVPPIHSSPIKYEVLILGIQTDKETLHERIKTRLKKRLGNGMIEEARHLHENGLSFERMDELGLEYRYLGKYLQGRIDREQLETELALKIGQYARRQMQWFKRDKRIQWFPLSEKSQIFATVRNFLAKNK